MFLSNITFANYSAVDACGIQNAAFSNHQDPDVFFPHYFSGVTKSNVSVGGLIRLNEPNNDWRNAVRCGVDVLFEASTNQLLNLNCAGASHTLLYDTDGSLSGAGAGTVLQGTAPSPRLAYDQSAPILNGSCSVYGGSEIQVRQNYAGEQVQYERACTTAADPHFFVMESTEPDTETRNFGPLTFGSAGVYDILVPQLDHGWCFSYTCHKRLSTFYSVVNAGNVYFLNTTGTPPNSMRFWLPFADVSKEIVIGIQLYNNLIPYVWLETQGHLDSTLTGPPALGTSLPHGSYYYDSVANILWILIRGGKGGGLPSLMYRIEPVVQVSMTLALSPDSFYASGSTSFDPSSKAALSFESNTASTLNIDPSRVKITKIVAGRRRLLSGITISFNILPDPAILNAALAPYVVDTSAPTIDDSTFQSIKNNPAAQAAGLAAEISFSANLSAVRALPLFASPMLRHPLPSSDPSRALLRLLLSAPRPTPPPRPPPFRACWRPPSPRPWPTRPLRIQHLTTSASRPSRPS